MPQQDAPTNNHSEQVDITVEDLMGIIGRKDAALFKLNKIAEQIITQKDAEIRALQAEVDRLTPSNEATPAGKIAKKS